MTRKKKDLLIIDLCSRLPKATEEPNMKDLNNLKVGDIVVRYAPSYINIIKAEEDTVAKIGTKYIHLSMKEYGNACPRKYNKKNGYINYNGTLGMWKIFPGTLKEFNEWCVANGFIND